MSTFLRSENIDKKIFDTNLVKTINVIVQRNEDNSPFEWFVVGFLYAHKNNSQSLEKTYLDVHTIVNLSKTSYLLTVDDTNEILIRMLNNLILSQSNLNSQERFNDSLHEAEESKIFEPKPKYNFFKEDEHLKKKPQLSKDKYKESENLETSTNHRDSEKGDKGIKPKLSEFLISKGGKIDKDLLNEKKSDRKLSEEGIDKTKSQIQEKKTLTKENKQQKNEKSLPLTKKDMKKSSSIIPNSSEEDSDKEWNSKKEKSDTKSNKNGTPSKIDIFSKESPVNEKPSKTSLIANKASFKLTNNLESVSSVSLKTGKSTLNEEKAIVNSNTKEGSLLSKDIQKNTTPQIQNQGKLSAAKEEQDVDYSLTSSSFVKLVKKNTVKDTPKVLEKKPSGDTEDIFLSDPEEKSSSLILKQANNPPKSTPLEKKINNHFEEEIQNNKNKPSLKAAVAKPQTKIDVIKTSKDEIDIEDDNWYGVMNSNFPSNSQRKAGGPQLMPANDIIIDLDDEDEDPVSGITSMALNGKFKKQRISSIASDEFDTKDDLKSFSNMREYHPKESQRQKAVLTKAYDSIELLDSPTSPKQTKKNDPKGMSFTFEFSDEKDDSPKYTRKAANQIDIGPPKSLQDLRRRAREEEKASMELTKKLQEEKATAKGKKQDSTRETPSRATKKKKT